MSGAVAVAFCATGIGVGVFLMLTLYLELRIHALVRSGDLPKETMKLFRRRWSAFHNYGYDIKVLFSRPFRDIDGHSRRLVPILRAALVLAGAGFLALAVLLTRG